MINEIAKVFSSEKFGNVRVVVLSDGPWFVGKDIAGTLGYKNPNEAVIDHVDDEDKFMRSTRGSEMLKLFSSLKEIQEVFGRQDNWFINESGIYSMIFGSSLPIAREFKRWITHEVIPAIRKHGAYIVPEMSKELKAILALDQKQMNTDKRIDKLEKDIPLYNVSCKETQSLVRKTGVNALGGKESPAYKNKSIRTLAYSDIQRQLRREFGVGRYEAIKQFQLDNAKEVINNYRLPLALIDKIDKCNRGVII